MCNKEFSNMSVLVDSFLGEKQKLKETCQTCCKNPQYDSNDVLFQVCLNCGNVDQDSQLYVDCEYEGNEYRPRNKKKISMYNPFNLISIIRIKKTSIKTEKIQDIKNNINDLKYLVQIKASIAEINEALDHQLLNPRETNMLRNLGVEIAKNQKLKTLKSKKYILKAFLKFIKSDYYHTINIKKETYQKYRNEYGDNLKLIFDQLKHT